MYENTKIKEIELQSDCYAIVYREPSDAGRETFTANIHDSEGDVLFSIPTNNERLIKKTFFTYNLGYAHGRKAGRNTLRREIKNILRKEV